MKVRRKSKSSLQTRRRSGLAPLELVLNLPIWLLVMALIVIIGHAGVWKARAHTNARQAVWRTLYYRTGSQDPAPRGFNNDFAEIGAGNASPALIDYDPFRQFDVVRGPQYVEPGTGKFLPVRPYQFDMRTGLQEGTAKYEGPWPFLRGMQPGEFKISRSHPILDDRWQYRQQGLGANTQRRIQFLYPFDLRLYAPGDVQRYQNAAIAVILNPLGSQLTPLDVRPDQQRPLNYHWERFGLDGEYRNRGGGSLQRRLRDPKIVCSYDRSVLREKIVDQLIEEIRGTAMRPRTPYENKWGRPGRLTADYLQEYRRQRQSLQNQLDQLNTLPKPDPALRQALEQQIAVLEEYISQLEKFHDEVLTP